MSITVEDMNSKCKEIAVLRAEEAVISAQRKQILDKLDEAERQMIEMLAESGLNSYKSPFGQAIITHRTSVKTPKTPDERARFYQYLKERNLYETMITVNSQTLNAFYKGELEQARERGDLDFKVPGINEVTIVPTLAFRK